MQTGGFYFILVLMTKTVIVIPVFDDWECLKKQIGNLDSVMNGRSCELSIVAVNDGSSFACPLKKVDFKTLSVIKSIEVVNLVRNVGHQRAITLGLACVQHHKPCDFVIVMDSDGEDRAEDVPRLLEESQRSPDHIIFARRAKRSEGPVFRIFYHLYRILFRLLTATPIAFGNFCAIPYPVLKRLGYVSELWNHFASGVIRSRIPIVSIPTERGKRFSGRSKMDFTSLIILGLSAIAVSLDRVAVRLILASIGLILFSIAAIAAVVAIRFLTDLAIPGWATYAVIGFAIILVQGLAMSVSVGFLVLSYRTQKHFVPYYDYQQFVLDLTTVL